MQNMSNLPSTQLHSTLDGVFISLARGAVLLSIFVTTWGIAGYYPVCRLLSLGLLAVAAILLWMAPPQTAASLSSAAGRPILAVMLTLITIGTLQVIPVEHSNAWTPVDEFRQEFGGDLAKLIFPLTLSPWATKTWVAMATIGLTGFYLARILFNTTASRVWLLASIAVCGAAQVFWAIIQAIRFPDFIFWGIENPGGSHPFGTFLNRNHGADFVAMALACTIGLMCFVYRKSRSGRTTSYSKPRLAQRLASHPILALLWFSVIWLVTGLLISMSRGAWISVLLTLALLPLCWKSKEKTRHSAFILVGLTAVFAVGVGIQILGLEDRIERRVDDLEVEHVLSDARWSHWKDALPAAEHFLPLGSGLGTYGYTYLPFNPEPANGWWTYAHNQYLETLMEVGVPGLFLVLLGIVLALRACLKLCDSERSPSEQALGLAATMTLLLQSLHAFTDFGLMMPANLLTACCILGAAIGAPVGHQSASWQHRLGWRRGLSDLAMALMATAFLGGAIWHQLACVRSQRVLEVTKFSPSSPAPEVDKTTAHILLLEQELTHSPDNEELLRRLTQLQIHKAQRATYDQIRRGEVAASRILSRAVHWDATTLEAVITQLYDQSKSAPTDEQKEKLRNTMQREPNLTEAWKTATKALELNPIHWRTHLRLAVLGAVTGRPWKESLQHAIRLSAADPGQSLSNGLLAWATGDQQVMIQQWNQTLATDPKRLDAIFPFVRQSLTDEQITQELMPDLWYVPYRLAKSLNGEDNTELKQLLFKKAATSAQETLEADQVELNRAQGVIAFGQKAYGDAASFYGKAAAAATTESELHYYHALALYRDGRGREAVKAARIAMRLSPGTKKIEDLFNAAQKRHSKKEPKVQ